MPIQCLITTWFRSSEPPSELVCGPQTKSSQKQRESLERKKARKTADQLREARGAILQTDAVRLADRYECWEGYLFLAKNDFREYVVSTFIAVPTSIGWLSAGTKVADGTLDDNGALTNIEVRKEVTRRGIGTRLIEFMVSACEKFHAYGHAIRNSRYRPTDEGAALLNSCIRKGIIPYDAYVESTDELPPSPSSC